MLKRLARYVASQPRAYEIIQRLAGQHVVTAAIRRAVADSDRNVLTLDVGSASGGATRRVVTRTIALDLDLPPLLRVERLAVQADALALPFRDRAVSMTTCIAVAHHLDDEAFATTLGEIARVTRDVFLLIDAVRNDRRLVSGLLWRYDRGSHPRTRAEMADAVAASFFIERVERFSYLHEYWLVVARPRRRSL